MSLKVVGISIMNLSMVGSVKKWGVRQFTKVQVKLFWGKNGTIICKSVSEFIDIDGN